MAEIVFGPIQLLVVKFENPEIHGQILQELDSIMEKGIIRLIDLLFISKVKKRNIKSFNATQLDEGERMRFGAVVGGLIGYGAGGEEGAVKGIEEGALTAAQENYGITEEDILDITEAIPEDTAAAIFIIEHLWAKDLDQIIRDSGGILVSQGMLTPELLSLVGKELGEAIRAAEKKNRNLRQ